MILADGLLLSSDGKTKLYLIEPDPSAFKPIATAELLMGGTGDDRRPNQNWAPMALSNGKLLIRDQNQLKCVKVAQ
jgi:outer membrane protein assembly factor BamB